MSNMDTVTVDLGELRPRVQPRADAGEYSSPAKVIVAGLDASERKEASTDTVLRRSVQESLDDPRPDIPAEKVFGRLHGNTLRS